MFIWIVRVKSINYIDFFFLKNSVYVNVNYWVWIKIHYVLFTKINSATVEGG